MSINKVSHVHCNSKTRCGLSVKLRTIWTYKDYWKVMSLDNEARQKIAKWAKISFLGELKKRTSIKSMRYLRGDAYEILHVYYTYYPLLVSAFPPSDFENYLNRIGRFWSINWAINQQYRAIQWGYRTGSIDS